MLGHIQSLPILYVAHGPQVGQAWSREIFGYHNSEECSWHLVGGGQEYWEPSYRQLLQ